MNAPLHGLTLDPILLTIWDHEMDRRIAVLQDLKVMPAYVKLDGIWAEES